MFTLNLISIAIATLFTTVRAIPTPESSSSIPGYTITDFVWEIESYPGGPKANVTGTIQDIATHLSTVNPNWKTDFNLPETSQEESTQRKRDLSFPFTGILCWVREDEWGFAFRLPLLDDINFLNVVPGNPVMGPGPGACGRVACSNTAAIYWCNDETQTFSLPSFATIAAGATAILNNCLNDRLDIINGQVFAQFLQNWNVIVRSDSC